ncbi:MAG: DUF364 domain-containing protein [Treponema sp.]|jgi:uncharacterized protein (DUF4213/DUF364 family)|nr:DUF364 domain-containing protein [Treponema sp.]
MWELYDALLAEIPPDARVDEIICGARWIMARSGEGVGICGAMADTWRHPQLPRKSIGMPLRELAACIKSWDFIEAGIGLAALNAYYNAGDRLRGQGLAISTAQFAEDRTADPFIALQREVQDKNVTVIGHFPYIDQLLAPVCNLAVVEKFYPQEGDYPESAADYLLPGCDFAFISSYTLVEKSLPRMLRLAAGAHTVLVGPATPAAPVLRRFGADDFGGFVIKDLQAARDACLGITRNIRAAGHKFNLRKPGGPCTSS